MMHMLLPAVLRDLLIRFKGWLCASDAMQNELPKVLATLVEVLQLKLRLNAFVATNIPSVRGSLPY